MSDGATRDDDIARLRAALLDIHNRLTCNIDAQEGRRIWLTTAQDNEIAAARSLAWEAYTAPLSAPAPTAAPATPPARTCVVPACTTAALADHAFCLSHCACSCSATQRCFRHPMP